MGLVHLSGFDSNKYYSILYFKKRISEYSDSQIEQLLSRKATKNDRKIDKFGEITVGKIRQPQKRLTPEEIHVLITEYQLGKEPIELGKEFGIHRITVGKILRRNGVPIRNTCPRKI